MFTGIIESLGVVIGVTQKSTQKTFKVSAPFTSELTLGQSIAHNGVCLTVEKIAKDCTYYVVTAVAETLKKTNLNQLVEGSKINLERCMLANGRFDGHIVQGHVDCITPCIDISTKKGNWLFTFEIPKKKHSLLVEHGSICINGISLTIAQLHANQFTVAIIPFTLKHTTMSLLKKQDPVNIEFDILGKYVARINAKH